ncbi:leucine-rich repeat domain-containing protein [uncultured Bacteroides sp.]|uniref:leucine-rich repeat domain-containing protein n=1 Tax=uncultured Bacteroides sp. TaxID=162156 RepID=UPI00280BC48C|nr:leucine-rich repeat domain-containing protein [uncultured Bacteroides sp.]
MNNDPSVVEITVCNPKGEPLGNTIVEMYDETTYEAFKEKQTTKALWEVVTDKNGKATFVLERQKWFVRTLYRELMFVVLETLDAANYEWWSKGGTVTAGKKQSFKIVVNRQEAAKEIEKREEQPEGSPFLIENGVLKGIKDPTLSQVIIPAEVKSIAPEAFWESNVESLVLNEGLESIGVQAFARSKKLASVSFPSSLKVIEKHAFEDCVSLTKVNLSHTAVEEIGSNAFRETGVNKVAFPVSLKKIGSQAFLKTQLENVVLPVSVEEIGPEAFREVVSLKSITLPNNIQKIGWQAFYGCTKLANVNYAGSMKSAEGVVESAAFEGCEALTRIILPQSIAEVQEGVFIECNKLTQIILPENVKKIGGYGLRTNYPVEKIVFKSRKAPEVEDSSLPFVDDLTSIVVPKGKLEEYKAAYADYQKIMTEKP